MVPNVWYWWSHNPKAHPLQRRECYGISDVSSVTCSMKWYMLFLAEKFITDQGRDAWKTRICSRGNSYHFKLKTSKKFFFQVQSTPWKSWLRGWHHTIHGHPHETRLHDRRGVVGARSGTPGPRVPDREGLHPRGGEGGFQIVKACVIYCSIIQQTNSFGAPQEITLKIFEVIPQKDHCHRVGVQPSGGICDMLSKKSALKTWAFRSCWLSSSRS